MEKWNICLLKLSYVEGERLIWQRWKLLNKPRHYLKKNNNKFLLACIAFLNMWIAYHTPFEPFPNDHIECRSRTELIQSIIIIHDKCAKMSGQCIVNWNIIAFCPTFSRLISENVQLPRKLLLDWCVRVCIYKYVFVCEYV